VSKTAISISTNVLAAIVKWSCQDRDRLHLCAVLFEKDRAIATDGHRMVLLPIPTHGHHLLVDGQHIGAAVAAQRDMKVQRPHSITIEPGDKSIILGLDKGVSLVVPTRDPAQYPPYDQVVPKVDPKANAPHGYILNPRYLAAIAEVNDAVAPSTQCGIRVVAWSPSDANGQQLGAMLFEGHEGVQFVVMPMRSI